MNDRQLLDWMIFYTATVVCSRDGEDCFVEWYPSNPELDKQRTKWFTDAREAIRFASGVEESLK